MKRSEAFKEVLGIIRDSVDVDIYDELLTHIQQLEDDIEMYQSRTKNWQGLVDELHGQVERLRNA